MLVFNETEYCPIKVATRIGNPENLTRKAPQPKGFGKPCFYFQKHLALVRITNQYLPFGYEFRVSFYHMTRWVQQTFICIQVNVCICTNQPHVDSSEQIISERSRRILRWASY